MSESERQVAINGRRDAVCWSARLCGVAKRIEQLGGPFVPQTDPEIIKLFQRAIPRASTYT